jgi:hypothetical protein
MTHAVQAATALSAVIAGPAGTCAGATGNQARRLRCVITPAIKPVIKRQHARLAAVAQSHPQ